MPLIASGGALTALAASKVAGDLAVRRYEDVDPAEIVPPGRTATIDGVRLHYHDEGSGPALVLLHGLGASAYSFRLNRPELSRGFRVITVDLPGHGYSDRTVPNLSMTAQAQYVLGLLDHIRIAEAAVVGHSMGGSVAQRMATLAPGRVSRLVLIGSTTDEFMRRASAASGLLKAFIPAFVTVVLHNRLVRKRYHRLAVYDAAHITPEVSAAYAAPGRVKGHAAAYQRLMLDRRLDPPLDLGSIDVPALIIWGDTDRIVPIGHGRLLERGLGNASMVVVPRAGHWLPEERPEVLNQLIADFCAAAIAPAAPASH